MTSASSKIDELKMNDEKKPSSAKRKLSTAASSNEGEKKAKSQSDGIEKCHKCDRKFSPSSTAYSSFPSLTYVCLDCAHFCNHGAACPYVVDIKGLVCQLHKGRVEKYETSPPTCTQGALWISEHNRKEWRCKCPPDTCSAPLMHPFPGFKFAPIVNSHNGKPMECHTGIVGVKADKTCVVWKCSCIEPCTRPKKDSQGRIVCNQDDCAHILDKCCIIDCDRPKASGKSDFCYNHGEGKRCFHANCTFHSSPNSLFCKDCFAAMTSISL